MTTAYTTLLGLALPVQGELSGTWGDMVDNAITSPLDVAVAGTQTISGSQTAVTLSVTNGNSSATNLAQVGSGSTGSAQYAIINCTGNPASLLTITAPASSRQYTILNATSTSQSVKIVGVGPTTGVTIVSGEKAVVTWNGSDYVKVATSTAGTVTAVTGSGNIASSGGTTPNITFTGTLPVANGGTGTTSLTANNVILGNGTSAVQVVAPGTTGNVLTSDGTTWSSTAPAAQTYPSAGIAVSTGSAWTTSKTSPSGTIVGTTDTQTLTNKTFTGYTETIYALSGTAIDPANGTIQTKTLGANTTFTESLADGQSVVLMVNPVTYTVTWPSTTWINTSGSGTAPTLEASSMNVVILWQVGGTLYGNWAGSA